MGMRTPQEMKLHETIIRSLEGIYKQKGAVSVATNLDKMDAVVKGISVDLVVKNPITYIFKVETESTVNEGSALAWKQYEDTLSTYFLMVPDPLRAEANRICKKMEIKKARLCSYKVADNKLRFISLP
ncbi:MAG: hypothetical protein LLG37_05340 [Spirochaetia bacterium]|nr:hypothetical protein [Spirochaetia bacterium]